MAIAGSSALQLITAYRIVKAISRPWEDWEAFKLGLIDKKGKRIRNANTEEEHKALPIIDILSMNLKRLVQKLPGGSSKFGSLAAALFLLKEETEMSDEAIEYILEQLNIDVEYTNPAPFTKKSAFVDDIYVRNIEMTEESFLGHWAIFEGKDIIGGGTKRFITEQVMTEEKT